MASFTSSTKALCLVLVVIVALVGAASAAKPIPGSCLMAASTLCANADTNALRCLRKLAVKADARVPTACAEAIMADANPGRKQATRTDRVSRLLIEGGCTGVNNCAGAQSFLPHQRCNDVNNVAAGCSGCPQGTLTIPTHQVQTGVSGTAQAGFSCGNICCKAAKGNPACCFSWTTGISCVSTQQGSGGGGACVLG